MCYCSYIGEPPDGHNEGVTILNLGKHCEHFNVVAHELMHALGLYHEQQRLDRNLYMEVEDSAD